MAILNYTTKVPAERTISEIQAILVKAGADAVMLEYSAGKTTGFAFRINTPQGIIHYKLPVNVRGVKASMVRDGVKHHDLEAQAYRVSWRILKDWIEAQMGIIQAGMAELAQVLLPYARTDHGDTVYERFQQAGSEAIGITHQKAEQ
jgi:hypothetical protein